MNPNDYDDDDDSTVIHDNRYYANSDDDDDSYTDNSYDYDRHYDDDDDDDDTYLAYSDDTDYKFDYNNPLDADDGDDNDDNDNDDDDDDSYTYCSSNKDGYYNNNYTPNVIFDMYGNQFTIDNDDNVVPSVDKPMTLQAAQRQIHAIIAGCITASTIKAFTDQAKHKHDDFFLLKTADRTVPVTLSSTPTYAKNHDHDVYLYHRWNDKKCKKNTSTTKPTAAPRITTHAYHTASAPIKIPVKDNPSITPTLETLSTLDTRSSHPANIDTDAILSITIWNQPISQYQIPFRPNIRNRSRHHSTAVRYALLGVYDKIPNPSKLPCLLSFFTIIICVVLSCFTVLADSFTMVKIDDRFPDEWND